MHTFDTRSSVVIKTKWTSKFQLKQIQQPFNDRVCKLAEREAFITLNLLPGTHLSFCCRAIKFGTFDPCSPVWKIPKLYGKSSTQFWDMAMFPCGNVAKLHAKTCQFMDFKNCRQFYIYSKNNVFVFASALLLKLRLYFMHILITVFMNVWTNNIQVLRQKAVFWTNRCQNNQHPIHTCQFL